MRVITGEFRSRVLQAPAGLVTRPTSDRLRETLFNVLGETVVGSRFADLYAGSGAVGIEALSRGATHCLFAEQAPPALKTLQANVTLLGLGARASVVGRTVSRALGEALKRGERFDVIFLDPPYEAATEYAATLARLAAEGERLFAEGAVVVAEHGRRAPTAEAYGSLRRTRLLEQGDAGLSFYGLGRV